MTKNFADNIHIMLIPVILAVLVFGSLAGCASETAPLETPADAELQTRDDQQPAAPAVKEPAKTIEAAKPIVEEQDPIASLPAAEQAKIKMVRKILAAARLQDENYFFRYSDPSVLQSEVWVRGDVMKRTVRGYDEVDKINTYNMVYLFKSVKKAEGYCETVKSKCWAGKGPFIENYDRWLVKTPKDWVMELDDNFVWALDNKIADQLYHIIDYQKDGMNIRVWVNDYKGWPYKVEIREGNFEGELVEMYLYDDMDIGGVSDDDVDPLAVH